MLIPAFEWDPQSSGPYGAITAFTFSRSSRFTGLPSRFHLPNWTLMFRSLLWCRDSALAPIEHRVHLRRVRLIIDNTVVHFDPCMGLKRHLLHTDHQFRPNTVFLQEASGGRGAMQAKGFLPIPDAGQVHRRADLIH